MDPFESDPAIDTGLYWRLHGRGSYRYRYTDEDLTALRARWLEWSHLPASHYIFFGNMTSGQDARRFMRTLV